MRLFDTHSHVNFKYFQDDSDEVVKRALDENIWMVLVGAEYKTSKRAIDIANKYEKGVYAAVGLHPIHTGPQNVHDEEYGFRARGETFSYAMYEKLGQFQKVVAIGEIGLDYYHLPKEDPLAAKRIQKEIFIEQLTLSQRLSLPVIIHCRDAHDDTLDILREFRKAYRHSMPPDRPWGVMHCFMGNEDIAWEYFKLGLCISFTGVITFSNQFNDLLRKIPLDKIMVETDCPFMAPLPFRGKRNEPVLVKYVAEYIASLKNVSLERVAEITTKNALTLFNISI